MQDQGAVDRLIARGAGKAPDYRKLYEHARELLEQRDRELLTLRDGTATVYEVEMEAHTDVDDALKAAFDMAPEYLSVGTLNEDDWLLRTNCPLAARAAARACGGSVSSVEVRP